VATDDDISLADSLQATVPIRKLQCQMLAFYFYFFKYFFSINKLGFL